MTRIARVVVPALPHHLTQRGKRREQTFFVGEEYAEHRRFPAADEGGVGVADALHRHARTGRPLGSESFIGRLERRLGRTLRPQKPGPKSTRSDTRGRDVFSGFNETELSILSL